MSTPDNPITRREFVADAGKAVIGAAITAKAPMIVPRHVLGGAGFRAPSDVVNFAVVGFGGMGSGNAQELAKTENLCAVCDVDLNFSATNVANKLRPNREGVVNPAGTNLKEQFDKAAKYYDFREMLEKEKGIDGIIVATPDHNHAVVAKAAMDLGKHVYVQKPLTWSVHEARILRQTALANPKLATQMGNQGHSSEGARLINEWIQAGVIGPVHEAHVWVSRAWGLQSPEAAAKYNDRVTVSERPKESQPVPDGLDWDLWLGPAPARPFHSVYVPGPKWYRWWDFGNGTMSDLGSHWNDLPFWALKLKAPRTVEASGPEPHPEIAPASMSAVYEYPARGDLPAVKLTWYQGEKKPALWKDGGIPKWDNGVLFIGDKGMLLSDYTKHVLLPEKDFAGARRPEPTLPRVTSHYAEWIEACKGGKPALADFEYSGWLTEANHLGNVAYRVGKKIEWDADKLRVTNAPEAEKLIRRAYRKGWEL